MARIRYDRRLQFLRRARVDDGFTSAAGAFVDLGAPLWGARDDVSDGERYAAAQVSAQVTARFVVPWTDFTASIGTGDRIRCEGVTYDISGIKEQGRRARREITANAVAG